MASFLIYLIESSICLSILYIGYIFLFRKETYFNFIRIYLIASLILAISIPLIRINISFPSEKINEPIAAIESFKNYYEQIIYLTDPEFTFDELNQTGAANPAIKRAIIPDWYSANSNTIRRIAYFFIIVYVLGFTFFVVRFFYLLAWLILLIKKHGIVKYNGIKLIEVDKKMPSFSFLGFLFVNRSGLSEMELQQVIAHEKTHIIQWHSIDLLMVNLVTLVQWFNPLVWRLQKAFKTTHEYIADQKVVEQGYELLDYQSLLLRQLISIRSVELVNNFNLLSIKKRIAMMNKIESGFLSRLKALIALPVIAFAFIMLADMSCDMAPQTDSNTESEVTSTTELPIIFKATPINESMIWFTISLSEDQLFVNQEEVGIEELLMHINKNFDPKNSENYKRSVLLEISKSADMKSVDQIKHALRENEIYKIIYRSAQNSESDNITALPQKLPPKGVKIVDIDEITKKGIGLYYLKTFENAKNLNTIKAELREFILTHEKYIFVLEFNNNTSYERYISYNDVVYDVINELRNELSLRTHNTPYSELDDELQKEVRKELPITLTMKNVDEQE